VGVDGLGAATGGVRAGLSNYPKLQRTHHRPMAGLSLRTVELFTPLFTPARFFDANGARNFQ
ncbi:MAG: hypothetical protein WCF38_17115, partial [Pseudolabrys sp.]